MRISIEAVPRSKEEFIPLHYNSYLQGYIYSMFKEAFPQLHDKGFRYEKRSFRHFTFSRLFSKGIRRQGDSLKIRNPIRFSMSFLMDPMPNLAIKHLIQKRNLRIGNGEFEIKDASAFTEPVTGEEDEVEFDFQTLSPIVTYRTIEKNGKPYTQYYTPYDSDFYELIKDNMKRKYTSIFGKEPKEEHDCFIVPTDINPKKSLAIVKYKGFIIKGYTGRFHYKGNGKLALIAYNTGFGAKNPQGFGMADYYNVKTA